MCAGVALKQAFSKPPFLSYTLSTKSLISIITAPTAETPWLTTQGHCCLPQLTPYWFPSSSSEAPYPRAVRLPGP